MITLTAEIDLGLVSNGTRSSAGVEINAALTNCLEGNNVSASLTSILNEQKLAKNPFTLGASIVGGGSTIVSTVDYYIGKVLSDSNGIFPTSYQIVIDGYKLNSLTLGFDTYNNTYPNSITINSQAYEVQSVSQTFNLAEEVDTIQIEIDNWNMPNSPFVLTELTVDSAVITNIIIDRRNLMRLEASIFDRGDISLPSWGIISNGGRLEFNDPYGEVKVLAEQNLLTSNQEVVIYVNNTLVDVLQKVAEFYTSEWDYDTNNKIANVTLKDDLEEWQNIIIEGINYDPRTNKRQTLRYIYDYLWSKTPSKYKMLPFEELDSATQTQIQSIYLDYPIIERASLWSQWHKFCVSSQSYIYKSTNGKVTCVSNGGN